jgi:hypothetical protein
MIIISLLLLLLPSGDYNMSGSSSASGGDEVLVKREPSSILSCPLGSSSSSVKAEEGEGEEWDISASVSDEIKVEEVWEERCRLQRLAEEEEENKRREVHRLQRPTLVKEGSSDVAQAGFTRAAPFPKTEESSVLSRLLSASVGSSSSCSAAASGSCRVGRGGAALDEDGNISEWARHWVKEEVEGTALMVGLGARDEALLKAGVTQSTEKEESRPQSSLGKNAFFEPSLVGGGEVPLLRPVALREPSNTHRLFKFGDGGGDKRMVTPTSSDDHPDQGADEEWGRERKSDLLDFVQLQEREGGEGEGDITLGNALESMGWERKKRKRKRV